MVNRREKPLVVPGLWDAFALVLGLLGMLFGTGPILLQTWFARLASTPIDGNLATDFDSVYYGFWLIDVGYYGFVLTGIAWLLLSRRHHTVIYNVDPDGFLYGLHRTMLEFGWASPTVDDVKLEASVVESALGNEKNHLPKAPEAEATPRLRWDRFGAFCNVTLRWLKYQPEEKARFERLLQKVLSEESKPAENPASTWFLGVGGLLFGFLCFLAVFTVLILTVPRRF